MKTYEIGKELRGEGVKRFFKESLRLPTQTTNTAQLSKSAIEKIKYKHSN